MTPDPSPIIDMDPASPGGDHTGGHTVVVLFRNEVWSGPRHTGWSWSDTEERIVNGIRPARFRARRIEDDDALLAELQRLRHNTQDKETES